MAQTIRSCLDSLPGSTGTWIVFITHDSTIHLYNMKSLLQQPQMMVVSDLDDIFVPLPDDLLVNLSESRTVVEALHIPGERTGMLNLHLVQL
ncbi:Protein transport protein Sec24A [Salvia divinorum]|uniref:Protein transport protein Sec24A n=1 Tax=Salvia divinorum TaxID=28513 RepID=A0ABD1IC33_SALDI